jgi:hypothetical protein
MRPNKRKPPKETISVKEFSIFPTQCCIPIPLLPGDSFVVPELCGSSPARFIDLVCCSTFLKTPSTNHVIRLPSTFGKMILFGDDWDSTAQILSKTLKPDISIAFPGMISDNLFFVKISNLQCTIHGSGPLPSTFLNHLKNLCSICGFNISPSFIKEDFSNFSYFLWSFLYASEAFLDSFNVFSKVVLSSPIEPSSTLDPLCLSSLESHLIPGICDMIRINKTNIWKECVEPFDLWSLMHPTLEPPEIDNLDPDNLPQEYTDLFSKKERQKRILLLWHEDKVTNKSAKIRQLAKQISQFIISLAGISEHGLTITIERDSVNWLNNYNERRVEAEKRFREIPSSMDYFHKFIKSFSFSQVRLSPKNKKRKPNDEPELDNSKRFKSFLRSFISAYSGVQRLSHDSLVSLREDLEMVDDKIIDIFSCCIIPFYTDPSKTLVLHSTLFHMISSAGFDTNTQQVLTSPVENGYSGINIFEFEHVYIPALINNCHWVLFHIDFTTSKIFVIDPLPKTMVTNIHLNFLLKFLEVEYARLRPGTRTHLEVVFSTPSHPQDNSIDCGVYVMEALSRLTAPELLPNIAPICPTNVSRYRTLFAEIILQFNSQCPQYEKCFFKIQQPHSPPEEPTIEDITAEEPISEVESDAIQLDFSQIPSSQEFPDDAPSQDEDSPPSSSSETFCCPLCTFTASKKNLIGHIYSEHRGPVNQAFLASMGRKQCVNCFFIFKKHCPKCKREAGPETGNGNSKLPCLQRLVDALPLMRNYRIKGKVMICPFNDCSMNFTTKSGKQHLFAHLQNHTRGRFTPVAFSEDWLRRESRKICINCGSLNLTSKSSCTGCKASKFFSGSATTSTKEQNEEDLDKHSSSSPSTPVSKKSSTTPSTSKPNSTEPHADPFDTSNSCNVHDVPRNYPRSAKSMYSCIQEELKDEDMDFSENEEEHEEEEEPEDLVDTNLPEENLEEESCISSTTLPQCPHPDSLPSLEEIANLDMRLLPFIPKKLHRLFAKALTMTLCFMNSKKAEDEFSGTKLLLMLPKITLGDSGSGNHGPNFKSEKFKFCKERLEMFLDGKFMELWHRAVSGCSQNRTVVSGHSAANRAIHLVRFGRYGDAMKAFHKGSFCNPSAENCEKLQDLHPPRSTFNEECMEDISHLYVSPLQVTNQTVLDSINSFQTGSCAGYSGLSPEHLKSTLSTPTIDSQRCLTSLTLLFNKILRGEFSTPNSLLCSALLFGIPKKNGGIRPIAVGEVLRRTIAKTVLLSSEVSSHFLPFQVGVGVSGGLESAVELIRQKYSVFKNSNKVILKLDFKNAFNLVSREQILQLCRRFFPQLIHLVSYMYENSSYLFFGNHRILSQEGTQQGDPLAPFLFSLVLQPLIQFLNDNCILDVLLFYLDDGILLGHPLEILKALKFIQDFSVSHGLQLNLSKCELFSFDEQNEHLSDFPSLIQRIPIEKLEFLGIGIGDPNAKLHDALDKLEETLELLDLIEDRQVQFCLLRSCGSICKINHILRTCAPWNIADALDRADSIIRNAAETVLSTSLTTLQWIQASFGPTNLPGMGLRLPSEVSLCAFIASSLSSYHTFKLLHHEFDTTDLKKAIGLFNLLWNQQVDGQTLLKVSKRQQFLTNLLEKDKYSRFIASITDQEDLARLNSCSTEWLQCIPNQHYGTQLTSAEFILSSWTLLGINKLSLPRGDALITKRHNLVRDAIWFEARKGGLKASLEPQHLLQDSNKKPADVFIESWTFGRSLCLDVSIISPTRKNLVSAASHSQGYAANQAFNQKLKKFDAKCQSQGFHFVPIIFETFGFCHPESRRVLDSLASRRALRESKPESDCRRQFMSRISVAIQRANAEALMSLRVDPSMSDPLSRCISI